MEFEEELMLVKKKPAHLGIGWGKFMNSAERERDLVELMI